MVQIYHSDRMEADIIRDFVGSVSILLSTTVVKTTARLCCYYKPGFSLYFKMIDDFLRFI